MNMPKIAWIGMHKPKTKWLLYNLKQASLACLSIKKQDDNRTIKGVNGNKKLL